MRHVEEERAKKKKKSLLIESGDPGQAAGVGQLSCGPRWAPDCGVCGSCSMCLKWAGIHYPLKHQHFTVGTLLIYSSIIILLTHTHTVFLPLSFCWAPDPLSCSFFPPSLLIAFLSLSYLSLLPNTCLIPSPNSSPFYRLRLSLPLPFFPMFPHSLKCHDLLYST